MRYDRTLSDEFESLLLPGGPLRFLIDIALAASASEDALPLDLQLREHGRNGKVTLYVGLTKILDLTIDRDARHLHTSAHPEHRKHFGSYGLARDYPLANEAKLKEGIEAYVNARDEYVGTRHYTSEGECQNWLSCRYGIRSRPGEWVSVDREVVVGYESEAEKDDLWGPIKKKLDQFGNQLPDRARAQHGVDVQPKSFGNEADCLLWHPVLNRLLVTEVKPGREAAGIYLSPIQVAAYLAVWKGFCHAQADDALAGIRRLLEQKVRLGLIPDHVRMPERMSEEDLRPGVIVQDPNLRSSCWRSLDIVLELLQEEIPHCVDGLQIFGVSDGDLEEITDGWRDWI